MAETKHRAHINLLGNRLLQALLDPQASDPASPAEAQVWVNTTTNRLMIRLNGIDAPLAFLSDVTSGSLTGALWDAQSVVVAVVDDTPQAVVIPEDGVLGRISGGNIGPVTATQLRTMLSVPAGALATETYVGAQINAALDGAPEALNTLNELAAALGDDPNFAATVTTALAARLQSFTANIGDGTATTYTVAHNLDAADPHVQARSTVDDVPELLDWSPTSANAIEVRFNAAPASGEIRVTVHG